MRYMILIALGIIALGCVQPTAPLPPTPSPPAGDINQTIPLIEENLHPLHRHQLFYTYAEQHSSSYEEAKTFFSQTYGLENETAIYSALPLPLPRFEEDKNKLEKGNGISLREIPYESYIQPEFYPNYETAPEWWVNAPSVPAYSVGFTTTPAEQQAVMGTDTNTFDTTLFVGSSWGVNYYQGMGFRYTVEPEAAIQLTFTPQNALLGPTFPRFDANWMHQIQIQGEIEEALAPGTYKITIYPNDAPQGIQEEWAATHQPYVNGNGVLGPSDGLATFEITVQAG